MIKIDSAFNGWIVKYDYTDDDGEIKKPTIFESDDDPLSEKKAMKRLLYHIMEEFGEYGSKHDPYRIRINIIDHDGKDIDDYEEEKE